VCKILTRKTFHTLHTFIPKVILEMKKAKSQLGGWGAGWAGAREKVRKVWKVWKVFRVGICTAESDGSLHAENLKSKLLQVFRRRKEAGGTPGQGLGGNFLAYSICPSDSTTARLPIGGSRSTLDEYSDAAPPH